MSVVTVELNGRNYQITCKDGQEEHLERLVKFVDKHLQDVVSTVGQIGQDRLLVMASLLIADELSDCLAEIAESKSNPNPQIIKQLQDEATEIAEGRAAHVFELLAGRIESIAERIEQA